MSAFAAVTDGARQRVLLVDDELPVRTFIAKALQREGFEILEAGDGLDALGVLQQISGDVDVLVTDIKMPRMSGLELVEKVKAEFPGVPVVYISGEHLQEQLHNPSRRVVFLQKPFRPQAMLDAIRAVTADSGAVRGTRNGENQSQVFATDHLVS